MSDPCQVSYVDRLADLRPTPELAPFRIFTVLRYTPGRGPMRRREFVTLLGAAARVAAFGSCTRAAPDNWLSEQQEPTFQLGSCFPSGPAEYWSYSGSKRKP
jgi:hypothetical protein